MSHLNPEHEIHEHRIAPIHRILYATDLSENMRVGLRYAAELARSFDAQLSLLNVVDNLELFHTGAPAWAAERDNALSRFRWAVAEEKVTDIRTEINVLEGEAHTTITGFAERSKIDLIVLNLHSKTFLERAMLGSTAERVIRTATIPVLSLPVATGRSIPDRARYRVRKGVAMLVHELMTPWVLTIPPETTIQEAARKMRAHRIGMLPVTEAGKILGVITDRDIAVRAVADACHAKLTSVREVMSAGA